jgi:hypothetical protein
VNLEPVVGVAVGWFAFGETAAIGQLFGAAAVLVGIVLSTLPPSERPDRMRLLPIAGPDGVRPLSNTRWF